MFCVIVLVGEHTLFRDGAFMVEHVAILSQAVVDGQCDEILQHTVLVIVILRGGGVVTDVAVAVPVTDGLHFLSTVRYRYT